MGCSFVQGSELGPECTPLPNTPVLKVKNRFSELVAEHFNARHINLAQGGAGQSRIFRTTVDWIENRDIKVKDFYGDKRFYDIPSFDANSKTLFLIGLSFPLRHEVWLSKKQQYYKWNIYAEDNYSELISQKAEIEKDHKWKEFQRFYLDNIHDEEESTRDSYRYMIALKSFIKHRCPQSDIFMFSALGDTWKDYQIEGLDLDRKYLPNWSRFIVDNDLKDKEHPKVWHPREAAHKELADHIINKYGSN